ncbi:MAG: hypothetical protein AAB590_02065 [Patescibacteria group bacterium]
MLTVAIYLFIFSLISAWAALHILSQNMGALQSADQITPFIQHNSLTEAVFDRVEAVAGSAHRHSRDILYRLAYDFLKSVIPMFRKFTHSTEQALTRWVQLIKGKRELNYLGRKAASPFVQNMRDHADETGAGQIHDKIN